MTGFLKESRPIPLIQPQVTHEVGVTEILLVSADASFAGELAFRLEQDFSCHVRIRPSLADFGTPAFDMAADAIFLDLRSPSVADDLARLCGHGYHPPVFGFG